MCPNWLDYLAYDAPVALFLEPDLAQHVLRLGVVDAACLRFIACNILIFLVLHAAQGRFRTQLSIQPSLEASTRSKPFWGRLGPQFGELALPFLRVAGLGIGQVLQYVVPRFVSLGLGKAAIGAHALPFTMPVLLQGGDKLSRGLPSDRSALD